MNFDKYIDRNKYPTMKWNKDFLAEHFGDGDVIPLSVADMDLQSPTSVIKQLQNRAGHGIYGYENRPESYFNALESWYQKRHGWEINRKHIESSPSILNAISILINQHSNKGDGVILQSPVFFEFRMVVKTNGRTVVKNPLNLIERQYQMDFDDLESKAANPTNKILILCNPHNPVGRVWTKPELEQVAAICERNNVFVIADEIHGDFAFRPNRYKPFLTISDSIGDNAAACISPAKTFNIAGIVDAMTIIPNEIHRQKFNKFSHRFQINKVNVFASAAIEAAYNDGADWLEKLTIYLQGNNDLIREYLQENVKGVSMIEQEGTFLTWLDFRELGLEVKALEEFLAKEAKIALSPGYWFGREGAGFARMTIGCPQSTIKRSLNNLATAVNVLT